MKCERKKCCMSCWIAMMKAWWFSGCSSTPRKNGRNLSPRGIALLAEGKYVRAVLEFRNAIQAEPEYPESYYLAGQAELKQGKVQNGYAFYMKTVEKQPDHVGANLQLGRLLLGAREFAKARERAEIVLVKGA